MSATSVASLLIETHFKKAKKAQRNEILQNFTAVLQGIKPSFLFDMCAVPAKTLQCWIEDWNEQKTDDELPALVLLCIDDCHHFIGAVQAMIKSLDRTLKSDHVFFVDVSCNLEYPKLIKDVGNEKPSIFHMVQAVRIELAKESEWHFNFHLEPEHNGCSLFGILLGFQIIYYHEPGQENCLSMIELRRFNVKQNGVSILSFSVPNALQISNEAVNTCLEQWKASIVQNHRGVDISEELIMLPNVIM